MGYLDSKHLSIIGSCGTVQHTIVMPERNKPSAIRTILFGRKTLGPTRKLQNPHNSIPKATRFIGLICLMSIVTMRAIAEYPPIIQLKIKL